MIRYYEYFCFQNKALILLFGPRKKKPAGKRIIFHSNIRTEEFEILYEKQFLRGQIFFSQNTSKSYCFLLPGFNRSYSQMEDLLKAFLGFGLNVVCFDYSGVGLSDGYETSLGYNEAEQLKLIYEFVFDRYKVHHKIIFGHSMGAITALWCSKRFDINFDLYFLESSYSSLQESIGTRLKYSGLRFLPLSRLILLWCCLFKKINYFHYKLSYLIDNNLLDKYIFLHGRLDKKSEVSLLITGLKSIGIGEENLCLFDNGAHESMYGVNNVLWSEAVTEKLKSHKIGL